METASQKQKFDENQTPLNFYEPKRKIFYECT